MLFRSEQAGGRVHLELGDDRAEALAEHRDDDRVLLAVPLAREEGGAEASILFRVGGARGGAGERDRLEATLVGPDQPLGGGAEEDRLAGEERRKNMALLNTYSSEKDIEEARTRALRQAEEAIKQTEKRITEAEKRRKDFEREKEFYAKKGPPPKLLQDIQNAEIELKNQHDLLDAKRKEIGTINARYDEDKRRYLELTKGATKK